MSWTLFNVSDLKENRCVCNCSKRANGYLDRGSCLPKEKNAQSEEFIVLQTRRSEKIVYIELLLLSLSLSCVRHVFKCVNENASDWTTGYIA